MTENPVRYTSEPVESLIFTIRGQRVILDADLARIYGVPTKALNQAIKRNADRFPSDFIFQLTSQEVLDLKPKIAASSSVDIRSQFVTASKKRNVRFLPYAFTEHGAIMAANVLNSKEAIQMSVFVVRAFVRMREHLISRSETEKRLLQIEKVLLAHDTHIRDLYEKIRPLLLPPPDPKKKQIGFRLREKGAVYRRKLK